MTPQQQHKFFLQLEGFYRNAMSITDAYEDYETMLLKEMKDQAVFILEFLANQYTQALEMFWRHPNLTPQQVSDALGTQAESLFTFYSNTKQLVETRRPNSLPDVSDYGTVTIHPDGSVTVTSIV